MLLSLGKLHSNSRCERRGSDGNLTTGYLERITATEGKKARSLSLSLSLVSLVRIFGVSYNSFIAKVASPSVSRPLTQVCLFHFIFRISYSVPYLLTKTPLRNLALDIPKVTKGNWRYLTCFNKRARSNMVSQVMISGTEYCLITQGK